MVGPPDGVGGRMLHEPCSAARRQITDALGAVRKVLTEEQWQRLPERIRNPFERAGRRRGG